MRNPWPDIAANGCTLYIFHFVKERIRGQTHRELSTTDPAGPHCLNLETRTHTRLVELVGIEPTTLGLQSRCSPS